MPSYALVLCYMLDVVVFCVKSGLMSSNMRIYFSVNPTNLREQHVAPLKRWSAHRSCALMQWFSNVVRVWCSHQGCRRTV